MLKVGSEAQRQCTYPSSYMFTIIRRVGQHARCRCQIHDYDDARRSPRHYAPYSNRASRQERRENTPGGASGEFEERRATTMTKLTLRYARYALSALTTVAFVGVD